jgi:hypothetical protein
MKTVGVKQRVTVIPEYGDRRDCLEQAWTRLLAACDLFPGVAPNVTESA